MEVTQHLHDNIKCKLNNFVYNNNIPNIIFHGPHGSGKTYLLHYFLDILYENVENKSEYIMYINCAFGKGIKFIRDELKFFAKTNICSHKQNEPFCKSIVLLHADNLTIDAQSALRRCIEVFSYNTRFFILVNNKAKLIDPIISRFSELHVPNIRIRNKVINLHQMNKLNYRKTDSIYKKIKHRLSKIKNQTNLIDTAYELYNIGCSTIMLIDYISKQNLNSLKLSEFIFECEKMRINIRFEVMSLYLCLEMYKLRFICSNEM